jgi:ribonuclease PH
MSPLAPHAGAGLFTKYAVLSGRTMTRDQRRALRRLARVPRGIVKTLMFAHGFKRELIATLVLAGLVRVVIDTAKIGDETIDVDLVVITDAGRKALEEG